MIVFLTLCYCAILAALVKFGVIKWTLWWKLSPLAWMLLLFVVLRSWMSFVPSENTTLGVGIPQYALRHVQPGQKAEVTLKLLPGRVFSATVNEISYISSQGQLQPSGLVMTAPGVDQEAVPFAVRLALDDDASIDLASLPGGAVGTAAIYTNKAGGTHIIRRVMLRMEAWLNHIKPW